MAAIIQGLNKLCKTSGTAELDEIGHLPIPVRHGSFPLAGTDSHPQYLEYNYGPILSASGHELKA